MPVESVVSKYTQIYLQLKEQMLHTGQLTAGSKLPSSRHLAGTLNVSRNTVCAAYEKLYAEGYLERRPRQGFFVSDFNRMTLAGTPPASAETASALPASAETASALPDDASEPFCAYDFRPRRVDLTHFPFPLWNKLFCKAANDYRRHFYTYGHTQGEPGLRGEIARFLSWHRGISCLPEQIVLCDGTQQALTLLCQLLREKLSTAAIEEPGNFGARVVFQNQGLPVIPIPVEADGIDVGCLKTSGADIVYVTPSRQFPSGAVMSLNKRAKLLDWASENDALIVEDDFNCYFRFNGGPLPALSGMSNSERVVYLGSFAQAVFPAARISYIVLPPVLLSKYAAMFQHYDSPVSVLLQKTMELFIAEGHFERHLRKMNVIYKKKHDLLFRELREKAGDYISINTNNTGLHLLITVNDTVGEQELIERAARCGVKLGSMTKHYIDPPEPAKPTLLLSFSGIDQNDIPSAVDLLRKAWIT